MYSMVMMMAMAGSGDVASFGHKGGSCCGTPTCEPVAVASGCCGGGHHRAGLLSGWKAKHSCHGSAEPVCCAPAPVYVAPAPVYVAPAPACCAPAPSYGCSGCSGGHVGLFARMKAKHSCCGGSTVSYAPVATPCCGGPVMVPATPVAPPKDMPKPMGEMPKKS